VLYVSSPIGLGHARRDLAIADELRKLKPGLEVHWLAQHPVTELLRRRSELIHPASAFLASESGHIESEAAEHDLHAFQAVRSMDEILVANFMVFAELTASEPFDLWVGDEAWDIDYFLHENPELKRAPYAWMTDFVGWLPMPDDGPREQALTADYNAEMIEQIARFPALRDRSVFVGNPDDVVPDGFGNGLPAIRDWVERNYRFSGYVSGFGPDAFADRDAIRAEFGYRPGEQVCVVTVGGSGVGTDLLRRAVAAYPAAKALVPGLRMVVVTGPRIDPDSLASLPAAGGLEVRGYVPDLYRHLAACDLAVVQGGLTTTMELTASGRPFIYVPLRHHFEQNFHVRHRLDRYGAGRCLDYDQTGPEALAQAIADEIGRPVSYRPVETDGAARAAALLAELVLAGPSEPAYRGRPVRGGLSEALPGLAGRAQHVRQPVLTGEPGGSLECRPGLLAPAQPGQGAAVRRERRGQGGDPRLPLRDGQQRRQHRASPIRLAVPQPCFRERQVRLVAQHPGAAVRYARLVQPASRLRENGGRAGGGRQRGRAAEQVRLHA
jgi:predicted glycosyltransferase